MKTKFLGAVAVVCLLATVVYAQTGLAGKWETDPPAAGARGGGQTRLDLKIDGGKVTGTMFECGADLEVKEGAATAKQAKWYTIRQLNGADFRVNWTADLTDDNTVSLSREFPKTAFLAVVLVAAVVVAPVAVVAVVAAHLQPLVVRLLLPLQLAALLRAVAPRATGLPVAAVADAVVVAAAEPRSRHSASREVVPNSGTFTKLS